MTTHPTEPRCSYDLPARYPFCDPRDFDWVLVASSLAALLAGCLLV